MKPWITDAIGTQKVCLPSSVDQATLAVSEKFSMPGRLVRSSSWPALNRASEASNGRQVMMSAAEPPCSLVLSEALYSVDAVGANVTLISGCSFMNTGRILSCQIGRSSGRQLSMVIDTGSAKAEPAPTANATAAVVVIRI